MPEKNNLETIYLEITNRCNLRCSTCPRSFFHDTKQTKDMSFEGVRSILEQVPRGLRVVLHGLGEPLLHPQIAEIVALVKSYQHFVLFNTNSIGLNRMMAIALIEAGLDELRISVQASDLQTYRKTQSLERVSVALRNIAVLIMERQRCGKDNPKLSFWMMALRGHINLLPDLVLLAAKIGVPEVYLQRLVFFGQGSAVKDESIYRKSDQDTMEALQKADRTAVKLNIRLWGAGNEKPLPISSKNTADKIVTLSNRPWSACYRPFKVAYIMANGNLLPCCIAPFSAGPDSNKFILGNIFQEAFDDIWNGRLYAEFRQAFQADLPWECCRHCGLEWSL